MAALTTIQRLQAMEEAIEKLQTAINNLASKKQLSQLSVLKQADIKDLQDRVASLEASIAIILATI